MPILIYSKNIYEKSSDIVRKNAFPSFVQSINDTTKKEGNIFKNPVSFEFQRGTTALYEDEDGDNYFIIGAQRFHITYPFENTPSYKKVSGNIKAEIKKAKITIDSFGYKITSHTLRAEYIYYNRYATESNPYIKIIEETNPQVELQGETIFFKFECTLTPPSGGSDFLQSATFYLIGEYIEPEEIAIGNNSNDSFSLDTNELIQSTNYIEGGSGDYYSDILQQYSTYWQNGKETAFLRCAVGDYGYIDSESKQPIKRTFRINDEVVPYSFNAEGQEEPLSQDANGHAKIFVVLGVDFVYDGALWQELHLQETGAVYKPTIIALSSPIVNLYDDILQINDTNARIAQFFEIFVDDALAMKIPASDSGITYFSMKALGLSAGSYTINVCATAKKYKKSPKSGDITYTVGEIKKLSAPTIAIDGDTLTITDESGLAEEFEILSDGSVVGSVSAKNSN